MARDLSALWLPVFIEKGCVMPKSNRKGSSFERRICGELSLWWTDGKRDDVFWRASQSGGRAKQRGRRGRDTHGQHGDIQAVDPIGEVLIDLFTVELKRGYLATTPYDVLDRTPGAALQQWERWVGQVYESHQQAGSYSWWLITQRDRRQPILFMPTIVLYEICEGHVGYADFLEGERFIMFLQAELRLAGGFLLDEIVGVGLDGFLSRVDRLAIERMAKRC